MSIGSGLSLTYVVAAVTSGLVGSRLNPYLSSGAQVPASTTSTSTVATPATLPNGSVTELVCHCVCQSTPCSGEASSPFDAVASLAAAAAAGGGTTEVIRRRLRGKQPSPASPETGPTRAQPVKAEALVAALKALREEPSTSSSLQS